MRASPVAIDVGESTGANRRLAAFSRARQSAVVASVGIPVLIVLAPFEALKPLAQVGGQTITTVELGLLAVLIAWSASLVRCRAIPLVRTPLTLPWLVFLGVMLIAAVAAPADRGNALNMTARLALAFGVYLLAVNADRWWSTRAAFLAAAGSGAVASALILLEYVEQPFILRFLTEFRPFPAHVGDQVRAGGSFQYPTIASMYLEVVFALGLGLLAAVVEGRRYGAACLLVLSLLFVTQAVLLTFTRAGVAILAATLAIVGALAYRRPGLEVFVGLVALLGAAAVVQVVLTRSVESTWLRLTGDGQQAWYRASIDAPPIVTLGAGETIDVPITVTNTGRRTWASNAAGSIRVSYHWLHPNQDLVVSWDGPRTDLPHPVGPGTTVSLPVRVQGLSEPGAYRLMWDLEVEERLWFSTEPGSTPALSRATVEGIPSGPLLVERFRPVPRTAARPGRLTLWRAALGMVAERPLLGVGPDNFRLQYGPYAGLAEADSRVHSNNMYLEVLAGGGLVGALAFAGLVWHVGMACRTMLASATRATWPWAAGLTAAAAAIAVHGLVDSFLSFTVTYVMFAVVLGLVSGPRWSLDADRV